MPTTLDARLFSMAALMLTLANPAAAQRPDGEPTQVSLTGPRFGITLLSSGITDKLKKENQVQLSSVITQFGWQSERQFRTGLSDLAGLTEIVVLVGGVEQNKVLPSLSWIVGMRTNSGFEFGLGPNVTPVGIALAYVAGMTHKVGDLNIPLNLSIVPSESGVRMSVLTGFNAEVLWRR